MVLRRDGQLIETAAACSIKEKCIPARLEEGAVCRKCAKIWRQDAKLDLNQLRTMRVLIRLCSPSRRRSEAEAMLSSKIATFPK